MASLNKQAARRQRAKDMRKKGETTRKHVSDGARAARTANPSSLQPIVISPAVAIRKALIKAVDSDDQSSFSQTLALAMSLDIEPCLIQFSASSGATENIAELVLSRERPELFDALLDWVFVRGVVDTQPMGLALDALCDRIELRKVSPKDRVYEVAAFRKIMRFASMQKLDILSINLGEYSAALLSHLAEQTRALAESQKLTEVAQAPIITVQSKRL